MISKQSMFCTEKGDNIDALVETDAKTNKISPMSCTAMMNCSGATFCRFVNPLTTRNPLEKARNTASAEN